MAFAGKGANEARREIDSDDVLVPSNVSGRAVNVSCRLSISARLISSFSGVACLGRSKVQHPDL